MSERQAQGGRGADTEPDGTARGERGPSLCAATAAAAGGRTLPASAASVGQLDQTYRGPRPARPALVARCCWK